ncbi:MAG: NAD-dependent epimerase/dehydratase family protein [Actinomycetota bacterium]|nr:NAD-dependent epimerase/dehydratase family protein [Actinomycetota bacterium]
MDILVIGGTGHIGSHLVPQLASAGHGVTVVSRGLRRPYASTLAWPGDVTTVVADREAEEEAGTFGARVAELGADVVVDLTCFTLDSARALTDALVAAQRPPHLLHCGSIWAHGASRVVPTTEESPRRPHTAYGRAKVEVEEHLLTLSRAGGLSCTVVHPGHISGPGWVPVGPAGNFDLGVFAALATGHTVSLPDQGLATLQHVHAADVAGVFSAAIERPEAAVGESFHAVADGALTLLGYAEAAAGWWGREAVVELQPLPVWCERVAPEHAATTVDHLTHSPHCSMTKAADLLGFRPSRTGLETVREAVAALAADGHLPLLTQG